MVALNFYFNQLTKTVSDCLANWGLERWKILPDIIYCWMDSVLSAFLLRQGFLFFPKKALCKLHIFMTKLKCSQQKATFQTIHIPCALSPGRSKGTDQIHLVQHCEMLYTMHRNVSLFSWMDIMNLGDRTQPGEGIQYNNAKQQADF